MNHLVHLSLLLNLAATAFSGIAPSSRRTFEFTHSADYFEASNWRSGSPPCPRDLARLPLRGGSPPLISISGQLSQRELQLPGEGPDETGLVFAEGAALTAFDPERASTLSMSCEARGQIRQADFNLTESLDWFQPKNWRLTSTGVFREVFDALPVDRLPGACDAVRFRQDRVYFVKVLEHHDAIPIGQLEFAGRAFTDDREFAAYWRNSSAEFAARQFVRIGDPGLSGSVPPFSLPKADAASDDGDERRTCGQLLPPLPVQFPSLMKRVCQSAESCPVLREPMCPKPIAAADVAGACCQLCGAVVTLRGGSQQVLRLQTLQRHLAETVGSRLRLSLVRMSTGRPPQYQLAIVATAWKIPETVKGVEKVLSWLESNAPAFNVIVTSVTRSYSLEMNPSYQMQSSISTGGLGFGVAACAIVLAGFAAIAAIGRRRGWNTTTFSFDPVLSWNSWLQRRRHRLPDISVAEEAAEYSHQESPNLTISFTAASQTVSVVAFTNPAYKYDLEVSQPLEPGAAAEQVVVEGSTVRGDETALELQVTTAVDREM